LPQSEDFEKGHSLKMVNFRGKDLITFSRWLNVRGKGFITISRWLILVEKV
jgi:hypothetical protein